MYEQTNTMMETKTSFQIPQLLDGDDFTSEDLADDMEGLRLSFTRIKIPGGGHLQFEIPSGNPDVPDYAPYLEGVILYSHNSNAYWPEGSEYDDDQPPLCQSFDGKVGYGEPGGTRGLRSQPVRQRWEQQGEGVQEHENALSAAQR